LHDYLKKAKKNSKDIKTPIPIKNKMTIALIAIFYYGTKVR